MKENNKFSKENLIDDIPFWMCMRYWKPSDQTTMPQNGIAKNKYLIFRQCENNSQRLATRRFDFVQRSHQVTLDTLHQFIEKNVYKCFLLIKRLSKHARKKLDEFSINQILNKWSWPRDLSVSYIRKFFETKTRHDVPSRHQSESDFKSKKEWRWRLILCTVLVQTSLNWKM